MSMRPGKPITHTIVVRIRDGKIVLSADEVRVAVGERVRWVNEQGPRGRPFQITFKNKETPFGGKGRHQSQDGRIEVERTPSPSVGEAVPYEYGVEIEGYDVLDPKIVFETPPIEPRG